MGHPYVHAVHPHASQAFLRKDHAIPWSGRCLQRPSNMLTQQLHAMLNRERAAGFKRLAGTEIEASLPITQRLIDVLLTQAASDPRLSGLEVTLKANQEIGVAVLKPV